MTPLLISAHAAPLEVYGVTNFHCHGERVGDQFDRLGGYTGPTGNDHACPLSVFRGILSL